MTKFTHQPQQEVKANKPAADFSSLRVAFPGLGWLVCLFFVQLVCLLVLEFLP